MILLGAIALLAGARSADAGDHERNIATKCLAGLSCPYNLNILQLEALQSAGRAELDMGAVLAVLGVVILVYAIVFMRNPVKKSVVVERSLPAKNQS